MESTTSIEQKMIEMRRKNVEILKRHQEIEEDRQLAQESNGTVQQTKRNPTTMRGTGKTRTRTVVNQQHFSQENQRTATRRKFDFVHDRPTTQRVDYNRLNRERNQESIQSQQQNNPSMPISRQLIDYVYPFHQQSNDNQQDADEPAYAKKRVIVTHQANRAGSGRLNQQQQRTQEQGQRRREERMRRCGIQNDGNSGETVGFHLDIPSIPMWQNDSGSMPPPPPLHLQMLPPSLNDLPNDYIEQSNFLPNFVFSSPMQSTPFNGNGPIFFTQAPPLMGTDSGSSQGLFHPFHPSQAFENSNRHQFQPPPPLFQPPPPLHSLSKPSSTAPSFHPPSEEISADLPPRFRRPKAPDHEKRYSQHRPMSGDFDRLHNSQYSSFNNNSRFNTDQRSQSRPQSFYDFSSPSSSFNNFSRPSTNHRYQRNNNNNNNPNVSLPLSAYMNTDDQQQQWGTNYSRRRPPIQQRNYQQDRHQFPLSSYDPRQYGFTNQSSKRNDSNGETNSSKEIDVIEEWWEDENIELTATEQPTTSNTTVNDSGNSSLSTSLHLKESNLDDEENNLSTQDVVSPPSDLSTSDNHLIESLDKLQEELKLEESLEKHLASDNIEKDFLSSNNEPTTYDTAHFMQWAKEKFREELAGRLTAQEIEQHDADTADEDDDDDDDLLLLPTGLDTKDLKLDPMIDDENEIPLENLDALKDELQYKLTIDENFLDSTSSISVE